MRGFLVCAFVATAFAATLLAPAALGDAPPGLVGDYAGSYQATGSQTSRSMQIDVEKQHKRKIAKARIFATDLPEYAGKGRISKDGTTAHIVLKTAGHGRYVAHMVLETQIGAGGTELSGDYTITVRGLDPRTGTFDVTR